MPGAAVSASAKPLHVALIKASRLRAPALHRISVWAARALGRRGRGRSLSIRVVGRVESRRLNRSFRGQDHATNVLSFPAPVLALALARGGAWSLGDLAICPAVLAAEARAQRKPLLAHWAHLVVHGSLHLIDFDHTRERDARRMERREVSVLRGLGFANPYRSVDS